MNFKMKFLSFLIILSIGLLSFQLPKNIQKKVDKEIKLQFKIDKFLLEPVVISDEINSQLVTKMSTNNLFKIYNNDSILGYTFIGKAPSRDNVFDYLVLFDKDLIILKAKVLIYREDYGGEIGSKRWLKQFIGKTKDDIMVYENDIMAISGATISANSMTVAVNNLLKSISVLHQNKVM